MKHIEIKNDVVIMDKDDITLHFTYDEKLTLKELSEILDLTNKAINSINKENGIKSNAVLGKEFSTEINSVREGSVVLDVIIPCAVDITLAVLASYIYEKLKTIGSTEKQKKEESYKYPVSIVVNGNNNNIKQINIHINNHSD